MGELTNLWKKRCDSDINGGLEIPSVRQLFYKPEMKIFCFKKTRGSTISKPYIDIDEIVGGSTVIFGTTGQGKSNVSGFLCENIYLAIHPETQQCVIPMFFIDTMGEHKSIFELPDARKHPDNVFAISEIIEERRPIMVGKGKNAHEEIELHTFGKRDAQNFCGGSVSYYFDVSDYSRNPEEYYLYLLDFMDEMMKIKEEEYKAGRMRPFLIYIGEAHMFIPQIFRGDAEVVEVARALKNKFIINAKMGRKWGTMMLADSQRPADVDKNFSSQCPNRILLPVVDRPDIDYYMALLPSLRRDLFERVLADLAADNRAKDDYKKGGAIIKLISTGSNFEVGYFRKKESEDLGKTPNFADALGWKYGGNEAEGTEEVAKRPKAEAAGSPYSILGASRDASDEEVKAAWRRQLRAWHPDHHQNDEEGPEYADEMTKKINAAYENIRRERGMK